jgi:hypothetical protein
MRSTQLPVESTPLEQYHGLALPAHLLDLCSSSCCSPLYRYTRHNHKAMPFDPALKTAHSRSAERSRNGAAQQEDGPPLAAVAEGAASLHAGSPRAASPLSSARAQRRPLSSRVNNSLLPHNRFRLQHLLMCDRLTSQQQTPGHSVSCQLVSV